MPVAPWQLGSKPNGEAIARGAACCVGEGWTDRIGWAS